jgi:selenocysteine-specific elongation factor
MAFVIGTAGHVDHGKTALVRALTGQETDNLPAEKTRGISIDLGFAHFRLPDRTEVAIVDVPGHERFIRNMVAGAHGIDLVLFVIAADDGVMPQSEEHFAILKSLGVEQVLFVLTKTDLVDRGRHAEIREEIELLIDGSLYRDCPILPVSVVTGEGLEQLRSRIAGALAGVRRRAVDGWFRMPIDRAFTVPGRGVVVTGTLLSGSVGAGDEISLVPGGERFRVRGLQRHGLAVERGRGGERLAINLAGADRHKIARGDVACDPRVARVTDRLDAVVSVDRYAAGALKHGQRLRLHLGTAERFGTVILLGQATRIAKAGNGFAQIRLLAPVQAMAGDRFVIRDASGEHTLGGGKILDPLGQKRHRRHPDRLARLKLLDRKQPIAAVEILLGNTAAAGLPASEIGFRLNLRTAGFVKDAEASNNLVTLAIGSEIWIMSVVGQEALAGGILTALAACHKANPASPGPGVDELRLLAAPLAAPKLFQAIVRDMLGAGRLARQDSCLAMPGHNAGLSESQLVLARAIMAAHRDNPFSPPTTDPGSRDEKIVIATLERQGKLCRAASGMVFSTAAFAEAEQLLQDFLTQNGSISAAQFRDLLGTSRKYALALLETFDRFGRTVRVGDMRKPGKPSGG